MTTVLFVGYGSGERHRCDSRCHNARLPDCACCCAGAYHGKREGTGELAAAMVVHQEALLAGLAVAEQKGEALVYFARLTPGGKPIVNKRGVDRTYTDSLFVD